MQAIDVVAILLVVTAGGAFMAGETALTRSDDIQAIYWLAVGTSSLYASVKIAKSGAKA
jgi:hypothetical protein